MARSLVECNYVQVLGTLWLPLVTGATEYQLSRHDLDTGEITREAIAAWLDAHAGDFQRVLDFHASIGDQEYPWSQEESEATWSDCMWQPEE